jgi:F-type H+-transporting ATPase subunit b
MAGNTTKVIVMAQAEGEAAPGAEEAVVVEGEPTGAEGEAHAATEEHAEVFPPFDPSGFGGQLFWLAVTFVALYLVMSRVALPRIGGILETRRTRIEGDLKEAERLRIETDRALAAYEDALAEARRNAHAIAEETRSSIKADIDNKRKSVEADLLGRVVEAEARIQGTKATALGNVDAIAADTAQELVAKLAGKVSAAQARSAVAQVIKG